MPPRARRCAVAATSGGGPAGAPAGGTPAGGPPVVNLTIFSLAGAWTRALGLDNAREFEGAWQTTLVLVLLCAAVAGIQHSWWRSRSRSRA